MKLYCVQLPQTVTGQQLSINNNKDSITSDLNLEDDDDDDDDDKAQLYGNLETEKVSLHFIRINSHYFP